MSEVEVEDPVVASTGIGDWIDAVATKDYAAADPIFKELMSDRMNDALDAEKIKVAGEIYNDEEPEQVEMEFDEVEPSEDDIEDTEEKPDVEGHPV